jgi:hypothetical protein
MPSAVRILCARNIKWLRIIRQWFVPDRYVNELSLWVNIALDQPGASHAVYRNVLPGYPFH